MPALSHPPLRLVGRVVLLFAMLAALLGAAPPAGAAGTGHITGTVSSTTGAHPAGLTVTAWTRTGPWSWTTVTSTTTTTGGGYDLSGLAASAYQVQFTDPSGFYHPEYWRDQTSLDTATDVSVVDGATTAGISPTLVQGGRIRGRVTGPSGAGLGGISVSAYVKSASGWDYTSLYAFTATDGSYTLGGMAPGTYRIAFRDGSGTYAQEFYADAATIDGGIDLVVTAGSDASGIDARLAPAAHVTGTVTGPDGAPVSGVTVQAIRYDGSNLGFYAAASTDAGGHYDIGGLAAGTFRISFTDYQHRYFTEYWDDEAALADAQDIVLAAGATRSGIDAQLSSGQRITGTVTGVPGLDLGKVYAYAYQLKNGIFNPAAYAYVRSDGTFDVGPLEPGTYRVNFGDDGDNYAPQWWHNKPTLAKAQDITLTGSGPMSGIDAAMKPAAHLTGRITDTAGNPLAGVSVTASGVGKSPAEFLGYTTTDSDGSYDVGGLVGGRYQLAFDDRSGAHVGEYYDDQPSQSDADPVALRAGRTVAGLDAVLADAASVSGVVTGDDGRPISGVSVDVQRDGGGEFGGYGYTTTDAAGAYTVGGLQAGSFRVHFEDQSGGHLDEWYDDKPTYDTATLVPVAAGAMVTGRNARLTTASHLTGTVTGPGGQPIAGVDAAAFSYDAGEQEWDFVSGDFTDATGAYDVGGLTAGTYRLSFGAGGYASEYWNDQPTLDRAADIRVGARKTVSGRNAQLAPEGAISGSVTDAQGRPVPYLNVQAETYSPATGTWDFAEGTVTDASGGYRIGGLATYTYRVAFKPYADGGQSYALQFWNGRADAFSADDVAVTSGEEVSGIDAHLANQATISGQVTADAGGPADARVEVYRKSDDGSFHAYTHGYTASAGRYTVTNLPTGTYRLQFEPYGGGLAGEYYDDASSLATATDVVVSRTGQRVTGKNAALGPAAASATSGAPRPERSGGAPGVRELAIRGVPQVGSTLVAVVGSGRSDELSYQWRVGGVDVPGATGPAYTPGVGDVGQPVSVSVVVLGGARPRPPVSSTATPPVGPPR